MSDYLREAAHTKPDNVIISIHPYGVHIEMFGHRGIHRRLISWVEVETCRINPITAAINEMRATHDTN